MRYIYVTVELCGKEALLLSFHCRFHLSLHLRLPLFCRRPCFQALKFDSRRQAGEETFPFWRVLIQAFLPSAPKPFIVLSLFPSSAQKTIQADVKTPVSINLRPVRHPQEFITEPFVIREGHVANGRAAGTGREKASDGTGGVRGGAGESFSLSEGDAGRVVPASEQNPACKAAERHR